MQVEILTVGPFQSNCYVATGDDRRALVIDPGDDADALLALLALRRFEVAAYLLTHGHVDHLSALAAVRARHPAPVAMHPDDARWAFTERNQLPPFYGPPELAGPPDRELVEGAAWTEAGLAYRVLHTPGHSPGSVCLYLPERGALFAGDTLFAGSVGRTDLPGGRPDALHASLARLMELPDETVVYPGHGPVTTVGEERRSNPFVGGG